VLPVLLSPLLIEERITYYTYKSPSRRSFAAVWNSLLPAPFAPLAREQQAGSHVRAG